MIKNNIPKSSYGVLKQLKVSNKLELAVEEVITRGYTIIDSNFTKKEISTVSSSFDSAKKKYYKKYNINFLKKINEHNTIRLPIALDHKCFLKVLSNKNLHFVIKKIMNGAYILNQQNGIINPTKDTYNQALWHRDLPYQHFVSSRPLALNAIYCVDDFTLANGATFVLPSSHKFENLSSEKYIQNNAIQIEAKAGSYILLDCMLYHAGGTNRTSVDRRAINHVFTIPYFKQQINLPKNLDEKLIPKKYRSILGWHFKEHENLHSFFSR
jgi:ectoine hydroxylase-related dioxygenase (phytanoyl-CoA dioxygenase family)